MVAETEAVRELLPEHLVTPDLFSNMEWRPQSAAIQRHRSPTSLPIAAPVHGHGPRRGLEKLGTPAADQTFLMVMGSAAQDTHANGRCLIFV